MADRHTEEALRLAGMLKTLAKTQRRSVRSLEQQMGVGTSIFHKVLKGEVTLQVRHLLMILDALGIEWTEFFHLAYPRGSAAAAAGGDTDSLLGDLDRALGDLGEPIPSPPLEMSDAEFEERVLRVLVRHGLLREDGEEDLEETRFRSA